MSKCVFGSLEDLGCRLWRGIERVPFGKLMPESRELEVLKKVIFR